MAAPGFISSPAGRGLSPGHRLVFRAARHIAAARGVAVFGRARISEKDVAS